MRKEKFNKADFAFEPMTKDHLPLLFKWLHEAHVKEWWDSESDYNEFETRYLENINSSDSAPFIVSYKKSFLGYINYWTVEGDDDFKSLLPSNAVGTDQFIGEKDFLHQGLGTQMVKYFTDWLLEEKNIPLVMTDPDCKNKAAIRCYEKAGFTFLSEVKTDEGKVYLMTKVS